MTLAKIGDMVANTRRHFTPPEPEPIQEQERANSDKGPAATDPTELPGHAPHLPENKEQYDVRLALAPVYTAIEKLTEMGAVMDKALQNIKRIYDAPIYEPATFSATNHPYVVVDHQRNHVAVFVATAQTVTLNISGVGAGISYNLASGWNQLDFPPRTEITAGASFTALFLYSMDRIATA